MSNGIQFYSDDGDEVSGSLTYFRDEQLCLGAGRTRKPLALATIDVLNFNCSQS